MKKNNIIGQFKRYCKKPNTIYKGTLYTSTFEIDVPNDFRKRIVRVYLPSTYDFSNPNKRFPVMYMTDGQNLVDHYTSGYGEWKVDETIESRIEQGKKPFIVVGVDCPHDEAQRKQEMSVASEPGSIAFYPNSDAIGYADKLAHFMLEIVRPIINETFFTLTDKENTAVGGSSMGGLMAFYMGMKYKDVVGFSLCFSPAFLVYKSNYFKMKMKERHFEKDKFGKFFFYTGGQGFEHRFIKLTFFTYEYLKKCDFGYDQVRLVYDSNCIHHEVPWSHYFPDAVSFWLDN